MNKLTKIQKMIVVAHIIWLIVAYLICDEYSWGKFDIKLLLFLWLPTYLYFAGVWIWGWGWLRTSLKKLNNPIFYKSIILVITILVILLLKKYTKMYM